VRGGRGLERHVDQVEPEALEENRAPRETPEGFLIDSKAFLIAGEFLLNRAKQLSLPAYFLFGRSIELSLKAFLMRSGMSPHELRSRKYGHNLIALFSEAANRGLQKNMRLGAREVGVLELLNYEYSGKRFEYRVSNATYFIPLIDVTEQVARKLLAKVSTEKAAEE
jgi:hypothetical protein